MGLAQDDVTGRTLTVETKQFAVERQPSNATYRESGSSESSPSSGPMA